MNPPKNLIIMAAIILVTAGLASSQQSYTEKIESIQELTSCTNITWEEHFPIVEKCFKDATTILCTDEPINQSCTQVASKESYPCITGTRIEHPMRTECARTGFLVNERINISAQNYICQEETDEKNSVLCEHLYDSDGDGRCKVGESCIRFVLTPYGFKSFEHSLGKFFSHDPLYHLPRATAEVLP